MKRWAPTVLALIIGAGLMIFGMAIRDDPLPAANDPSATVPADHDDVAAALAATTKYRDVEAAIADGYEVRGPCIGNGYGAAGFHYVNDELTEDTEVDPTRPEILLYVPDRSDGLQLVAFEYFRIDDDQDVDTDDDVPALFGASFVGPIPGFTEEQPVHYEMHAWILPDYPNPDGTFAHLNPNIDC